MPLGLVDVSFACLRFGESLGDAPTVLRRLSDDMLKPLFEPVQPKENDEAVNCDRVTHHCRNEQHHLLPCIESVDVDSVQSALRSGTAGEEQCVDIFEFSSSNVQAY
jgi:hypothetical protein